MPFQSLGRGRWLHTQRPASQREFHLSLWWLKHWGVGMKRRSVQSLPSVARRVNAWEFHHQTLHDTCSSALPSVYGGETPACGSVALRCILLQLTDRADFSVFVFVFLCVCVCFYFCFYCLFCFVLVFHLFIFKFFLNFIYCTYCNYCIYCTYCMYCTYCNYCIYCTYCIYV